MQELPSISEMHTRSDQNRVDFLETDLALCFTFIDIVRTELAATDYEAAERAFRKAEEGYATVSRFVPDVQNVEQRSQIQLRLAEPGALLASLQRCFDT